MLAYWRAIDAFQTAQAISRAKLERGEATEYSFYDGPPFATGLPHHGHLLMGSIKVGTGRGSGRGGAGGLPASRV